MDPNVVSYAVGAALISSAIASIVTYQGNPKGKKWKFIIPIGACFVVSGGVALVLGIMTGRQIIDVQTSRNIFFAACILVTTFSASVYFKYK